VLFSVAKGGNKLLSVEDGQKLYPKPCQKAETIRKKKGPRILVKTPGEPRWPRTSSKSTSTAAGETKGEPDAGQHESTDGGEMTKIKLYLPFTKGEKSEALTTQGEDLLV